MKVGRKVVILLPASTQSFFFFYEHRAFSPFCSWSWSKEPRSHDTLQLWLHHEELAACFPQSPVTVTAKQLFGAHHHQLVLQPTVKWYPLQAVAMKVTDTAEFSCDIQVKPAVPGKRRKTAFQRNTSQAHCSSLLQSEVIDSSTSSYLSIKYYFKYWILV